MKKWIQFNLDHPKLVLGLLVIITLLAAYGLRNLHFDSRTEAIMPKQSIAYQMGERAKQIFIDSKTFMIAAVEPAPGKKLFSYELFSHITKFVTELEEFKDFNIELENNRLQQLLTLGNITIVKDKASTKAIPEKTPKNETDDIEDDLDAELLGDESTKAPEQKDKIEENLDAELLGDSDVKPASEPQDQQEKVIDIWDLSKPLDGTPYQEGIRKRNKYNYDEYKPVKLGSLKEKLDKVAKRQLNTILYINHLDQLKDEHMLTQKEFKGILEKWEEAYLYKSMEILKTFMNPISGEDIIGTKDELKPVDFVREDEYGNKILPRTEKDFADYKATILRNPSNKSLLYSLDDKDEIRALGVTMSLKPQFDHGPIFQYMMRMIEKYDKDPVVFTPVGNPIFQEYIKAFMETDLINFMPMVFIVVIFTFFLNFRILRGVLLPTICLFLGTIWTLGMMGLFNIPITLVVNMLPPLLVAVGSSYSIHIFNQYLHDHESLHQNDKKKSLLASMSHISITVMLAAFTTFIGFLTLTVNQILSLRDFGIFAALGTMFSMVIAVMLIPSALMLMKLIPLKEHKKKNNQGSHTNPLVEKIVALFSHLSLDRPLAVVIISIVIIIFFGYGLSQVKVETGPMFNFKEDSYPYQSEMRIGELFDGTMVLNLIIDSGKRDGVKDPPFLKFIEDIREWVVSPENRKKYHMLQTVSFGDIIKRMHMAMNEDNPEYYKIPDDASVIRDYLEIFSAEDKDSDGRIDSLEQFIDHDYRYNNILIRTGNVDGVLFTTTTNKSGQKHLNEYLTTHPIASKYKYYFVGELVNFTVISDLIVQGQFLSVILTLIIVAFIIFILFRNWQAGLVAIIPITTSITIVYGIMGYLDIPLDVAKALLAAIAIGIGVDDTIHMLKTLRHNIIKGLPIREAMIHTHREAGVAIVYTSLALIFGFTVLTFSEFIPVIYLGLLVVSTMFSTTITALVLLPSVIVLLKLPIDKELNWRVLRFINLNKLFKLDEDL